jgi:hypothetical protein
MEMISFQRKIFERQRRMIEADEAHLSKGFTRYRNEYRRSVLGYVSPSGFGALCDAVASSKTAYIADYHTLKLAQRTFLKIIRGIMTQVDQICLCMEFVPISGQEIVNRFLERRISEQTFLKRIEYRKHWPYDIWPNFKPIFDLALEQGFPVVALDSDPSLPLKKRDDLAAEQIVRASRRFPDALLLSFVGQMHVAPSHLPESVDRAFIRASMPSPSGVIVYQNAEEIYWQLAEERREEIEVVRVDDRSFCVNNTPPLVQQLSYLHWIQAAGDIMEFNEQETAVRALIRNLGTFLDLPWEEAAASVRVFLAGDLDVKSLLSSQKLKRLEKHYVVMRLKINHSAYIQRLNTIYLETLSVNHAADESARYLKQFISKAVIPVDLRDRFYFYILNDACGFLGSKIINPKRKTDHEGKLRKIVASMDKDKSRGTSDELSAEFVLTHIALERRNKPLPAKSAALLKDPMVFHRAAHILGCILGDRLYYGLTSGIVSKASLKSLFLDPLDAPGKALNVYLTILRQVREVEMPRRI